MLPDSMTSSRTGLRFIRSVSFNRPLGDEINAGWQLLPGLGFEGGGVRDRGSSGSLSLGSTAAGPDKSLPVSLSLSLNS